MVLNDRMQGNLSNGVRQMLGRMPQWLRADLSSRDALLKERAEDALFAMIVATLREPPAGEPASLPTSSSPTDTSAQAAGV
ncbi:hypothetical protein HMP09_1937 [Sphingomonas sp. HMP9]|uniref:hypothetical protein n=1 Tax=Sphingomonas sp. HMP9 TaxID=1517554 RepID=UPI001596CDC1|nr:hypothetical protein [Sphingomonas sp. HMP9]BCA62703.1 hypothetical protein HMP09_1937 [Sphingomonas sp. HMP9]